jgi:hypothetical protein
MDIPSIHHPKIVNNFGISNMWVTYLDFWHNRTYYTNMLSVGMSVLDVFDVFGT